MCTPQELKKRKTNQTQGEIYWFLSKNIKILRATKPQKQPQAKVFNFFLKIETNK